MRALTRREALTLAAGGATAMFFGAGGGVRATRADTAAEIAKFTGGKAAENSRIAIELPEIAENGNTVPLSVVVDSPMTPADYVTDLLVVADGNPRPIIATFRFTPMSGRAEAATRSRLAASQTISVVAKTSAGRILAAQKQVKVTIGGCGG